MILRLGKNFPEKINHWKRLGYRVRILAYIKPCRKAQRKYGIHLRLTSPRFNERGCQGAIIHIK